MFVSSAYGVQVPLCVLIYVVDIHPMRWNWNQSVRIGFGLTSSYIREALCSLRILSCAVLESESSNQQCEIFWSSLP